jgi:hypothetical protein
MKIIAECWDNQSTLLQEAHFLSGSNKKAGLKMFKNGIKRNGLFNTLTRGDEAEYLRGLHVAKIRKSGLGRADKYLNPTEKEMLSNIGRRAIKGKQLSSDQVRALKDGHVKGDWIDYIL